MTVLNLSNTLSIPTQGGKTLHLGQLHGATAALVISELATSHQRPLLIITTDSLSANRLEDSLRFFMHEADVPIIHFPDWETLPYDHFSPHHDIISSRIDALYRINHLTQGIIIAPVSTLMQRIAPVEFVQTNSFILENGDPFDPISMRERCVAQGYYAVDQVMTPGEFCVRGGIFDIFPMGTPHPLRIEVFDDNVESIRTFDEETQRTIERIDSIRLLPAREFPLDNASITQFRQQWRDAFSGNPQEMSIYTQISKGIVTAGIEYYLPLFFESTSNLIDYLPAESHIFQLNDCHESCRQFWGEVNTRFNDCNIDRTRPLLTPDQIYYSPDSLACKLKMFPIIKATSNESSHTAHISSHPTPTLSIDAQVKNPVQALHDFIQSHKGCAILICAESPGRRERLLELLLKHNISPTPCDTWQDFISQKPSLALTTAPIDNGMVLDKQKLVVITESALYGEQVLQRRRRHTKTHDIDNIIRNLAELQINAPVVHIDHGIGRYTGLETIVTDGIANEFLTLEYGGSDKLFVPISYLHLIARYGGIDGDHAPLDKLGSGKWTAAIKKAKKKIQDIAAELLLVYAEREHRSGITYQLNPDQYERFSGSFPFEETPDQTKTIDSIIEDLTTNKSMDRLVCGDVGFGKTEVAMRAAFITVCNKKQVAILVPTTLLAQQHYNTFQDRFADWPINIECLSRFKSIKDQKATIERLKAGKVDILIGTHKIIQPDIIFYDLGLVIIDEEHRFGVKQKERLKQLRAEVDILTLTATPIPRTLNMAMSSVRDLSVIATPPAKRLAVKTFIQTRSNSLIREAITREILRGGQVFFLHNKVESIERIARELIETVPEATIEVAHGQMREKKLEQVMSDFYHQRFNVLLCTTIIENGIDIPTANTIIIDKADHFGLAQLHQLRGRVGRSHHQAYAYLLTHDPKVITRDAKKRLEAFASLDELGAGFMLATHDLEIRGAGELLGQEQSGHIQTIGLSLYTELLERAVTALKNGEEMTGGDTSLTSTLVDIKVSALIPDSLVHDVHERLVLYKRLSNAKSDDQLDDLKEEIIDRFGKLPTEVYNLFAITRIRITVEKLGIKKLEANTMGGHIEFKQTTNVDPMRMVDLIQKQAKTFKMQSANELKFKFDATQEDLLQKVDGIIAELV